MEYWWQLKNTGYSYPVLKLVAYYYLYLEKILKNQKIGTNEVIDVIAKRIIETYIIEEMKNALSFSFC